MTIETGLYQNAQMVHYRENLARNRRIEAVMSAKTHSDSQQSPSGWTVPINRTTKRQTTKPYPGFYTDADGPHFDAYA